MSSIIIQLHDSFDALRPHCEQLNALARGNPFLQWDWLESWWLSYGQTGLRLRPQHRLLLISVWDGAELIGLAPWYWQQTIAEGRVIRSIGSGETCADYLSILSAFNNSRLVAEAIAVWLWNSNEAGIEWDLLELTGVMPGDFALNTLSAHLVDGGYWVEKQPLASSWRIDLRGGWERYLSKLSKNHRKDVRRVQRSLESGEFTQHRVTEAEQFPAAWRTLVDLHTRRRQSLGDQGCFHSTRFANMHERLAQQWLQSGQLELLWIAHQGEPIAVEYQVRTEQGIFAYQSGVDPTKMHLEPGRLSMVASLRQAIERGDEYLDLLRGDEPYKQHWRAEPCPLTTLRIVPNRLLAQCRFQLQSTGSTMKRWLKQGWREVFGKVESSHTSQT